MKFLRALIVFSSLTFSLNSCLFDKNPIDDFFIRFEDSMTKEERLTISSLEKDSLFQYSTLKIYMKFCDKIRKDHSLTRLDSILISNGITEDKYKLNTFILAFIEWQKGNNIDYLKILNEVEFITKKHEKEEEEATKRFYKKKIEIAKSNFDRIEEGDSVCLIFPYDQFSDIQSATYHGGYSSQLPFKDSLLIYGKALQLHVNEHPEYPYQKHFYYLAIKILSLNKEKPLIMMTEYKVGDSLEVDLNSYGRPIEFCNQQAAREKGYYNIDSLKLKRD